MDNYRGTAVSHQGTNTNNNSNPGGKNRNRRKKNKQHNNNSQQNNQKMPLSPSKNLINHYPDYSGSMSLDQNNYNRPFNKYQNNNQNYNYNNQNNRKYNNNNNNNSNNNGNNGKYIKRRNGSNGSYYGYENDRLNKSLTPNNSFGENSKIQTSISLDNFDLVASLNQKRSPISNSYSFMSSNVIIGQKPTSPYKTGVYAQQQTIIEQVNLEEEISETTNSLSIQEVKSNDLILSSITSTESLNTSGDFMADETQLSCYSTPLNHQSDSSRLVDPDLSPRKNRENEETLNQEKTPVKYDESEHTVKNNESKSDNSSAVSSDSSPDSKNSDQNLVTASEGEVSFGHENTVMHNHEHNLAKELEDIAHNFDLNIQKMIETESNKSVNGSVQSSSTESFSTTSNDFEKHSDEERQPEQHVTVQNLMIEKEFDQVQIEDALIAEKSPLCETNEEFKSDESQTKLVQEMDVKKETKQIEPDLIQDQNIDINGQSEIVIPSSYEIIIRPQIEEIDLADEEPIVLENEVKIEENLNSENNQTDKCEDKQDAKTENDAEVLNQTIESLVSELNKTNSSIAQKEPVVDCFSCTIV